MDPLMERLDAYLNHLDEENDREAAFETLRLVAEIENVCLWTAHRMRRAAAQMEMEKCHTT